jgi:hypothetical protein
MPKKINDFAPETRYEGSRFNNAGPASGRSSRKTTLGARQVLSAFGEPKHPDHKVRPSKVTSNKPGPSSRGR